MTIIFIAIIIIIIIIIIWWWRKVYPVTVARLLYNTVKWMALLHIIHIWWWFKFGQASLCHILRCYFESKCTDEWLAVHYWCLWFHTHTDAVVMQNKLMNIVDGNMSAVLWSWWRSLNVLQWGRVLTVLQWGRMLTVLHNEGYCWLCHSVRDCWLCYRPWGRLLTVNTLRTGFFSLCIYHKSLIQSKVMFFF
jgi:hypothetical protein